MNVSGLGEELARVASRSFPIVDEHEWRAVVDVDLKLAPLITSQDRVVKSLHSQRSAELPAHLEDL
jgi:hypothetical protein